MGKSTRLNIGGGRNMGLKELLHGCIKQYGSASAKTLMVSQKLDIEINKVQRVRLEAIKC